MWGRARCFRARMGPGPRSIGTMYQAGCRATTMAAIETGLYLRAKGISHDHMGRSIGARHRRFKRAGAGPGGGVARTRRARSRPPRATRRAWTASLPPPRDGAIAVRLDHCNTDEITSAVAQVQSTFGGIDLLVNNAGAGLLGGIEEASDDEMRWLFETNMFGPLAVTRAVLPGMRARRRGWIVNMSSAGGFSGAAGSGLYCATKFALEGFSEALAEEVAEFGIGVMIVEPGPFRTDFASNRRTSAPGDRRLQPGLAAAGGDTGHRQPPKRRSGARRRGHPGRAGRRRGRRCVCRWDAMRPTRPSPSTMAGHRKRQCGATAPPTLTFRRRRLRQTSVSEPTTGIGAHVRHRPLRDSIPLR